ncbi:hypothetical protein N7471_008403 [Penicillium samsonianum]|uniref:uncharacterized protein n=1 Tax=Penicillium samsonianum TaxID=1882272 RepID=UPI002547A5F2|nr:uncharacterized protein N7471_008403 [Penicillium samsonianum]KAJ6133188.1 hypothetical protein N7471_008403 [Penicillium samsonianum]
MLHSDYATKVFGFAAFGRIYGTVSRLDALTRTVLGGNPTPINISLATLGAVVIATLSVFLTVEGRKFVIGAGMRLGVHNERERLLLLTEREEYGPI